MKVSAPRLALNPLALLLLLFFSPASADPAPVTTDLTTTTAAVVDTDASGGGLGGLSYNERNAGGIARLTEAAYCTQQLPTWSCKACQYFPGMRNVTVINGEKRNVRGFVGVDIGDDEEAPNRHTSTTRGPVPDDRRHLRAVEGDRGEEGAARPSNHKPRIVITFSGTDPSSVKNWIDDLEATMVPNTYGGLCEECMVHRGFLAAYDLVKDQVRSAIARHMQYHPHVQILITGHSLGAALAVLCFLDLRVNQGLGQGPNSSVFFTPIYVYGSPRVGNEAFATLTTRPGVSIFRLVHHRDPVPHLPLAAWGYHHPPKEVFYAEDMLSYKICDDSGEDDTCSNQFWAIFGNVEDHLWYMEVDYSTAYLRCQLDGEPRAGREAAPALAPPAAAA
ncbi:unnamed protein product [Ectocarpus fasciculatus]